MAHVQTDAGPVSFQQGHRPIERWDFQILYAQGPGLDKGAYLSQATVGLPQHRPQQVPSQDLIRNDVGEGFDPSGWTWNNYLHRIGTQSFALHADCRYVIVTICADVRGDPSVLDVDTVSVWER